MKQLRPITQLALFADTEIGKNLVEDVFAVDQPSDLLDCLPGLVEIDGDEFGSETVAQRLSRMAQCVLCAL